MKKKVKSNVNSEQGRRKKSIFGRMVRLGLTVAGVVALWKVPALLADYEANSGAGNIWNDDSIWKEDKKGVEKANPDEGEKSAGNEQAAL